MCFIQPLEAWVCFDLVFFSIPPLQLLFVGLLPCYKTAAESCVGISTSEMEVTFLLLPLLEVVGPLSTSQCWSSCLPFLCSTFKPSEYSASLAAIIACLFTISSPIFFD